MVFDVYNPYIYERVKIMSGLGIIMQTEKRLVMMSGKKGRKKTLMTMRS